MNRIILQLIMALLGALGFSLVFGTPRRYWIFAALGGLLAWGVYLAVEAWLHSAFLACLTAAAAAVVYAELLARRLKTPATLFVIPSVIPLVPGSSLYYTMSWAVQGDLATARSFGSQTLEFALAIAAGLSFVMVFRELRARRR